MDLNKELKFRVHQMLPFSFEQDKICDYFNPTLIVSHNSITISRNGKNGHFPIIERYFFDNYLYIKILENDKNINEVGLCLDDDFWFEFTSVREKKFFLEIIKTYNAKQSESFSKTIVLENDCSLDLLQNENIFNSSLKVACSVLRSLNSNIPKWNFSMPPLFRSSEDYNEFFYLCFTTSKTGAEYKQWNGIVFNYFNWESHSLTFIDSKYSTKPFFTDFCKMVSQKYDKHGFGSVALPYYMLVNSIIRYMALKSKFVADCIDIEIVKAAPVDEIIKYYTYQIDSENLILDEVVAFLVCFIKFYNLYPANSIQEIIDFCNSTVKDCIDQIKIARLDNSPISPSNIAIALQEAKNKLEKETFLAQKKAEEEAISAKAIEERKLAQSKAIKEKIHNFKINQNMQKLIEDDSMENAVNNLISMFPNKTIYNFRVYHYTHLFFCGGLDHETVTEKFFRPWEMTFEEREKFDGIWHSPIYQSSDGEVCTLLKNFSKILLKRFNINDDELLQVTWSLVNYFFLKRYSLKWLESCSAGEIGDRDLKTYLLDCFNDGMVAINDVEATTLFAYYYCTINGKANGDKFYLNQPDLNIYNSIIELLNKYEEDRKNDSFEARLFGNKFTERKKNYYTLDDVDQMTGVEFEALIASLFHSLGFTTQLTKTSGDQGVDVIAEKNSVKYGIQAKCYSGTVGNSAVQEVVAGKQFYGLDKVFVVTNSKFTKSAIKLAQSNNVILWDRNILADKLALLK